MKVLSEEFLALPAHRQLPLLAGGFDGRIQWIVNDTPEGNVRVLTVFENGQLVDLSLASDRDAELTLTIRHPDLLALFARMTDLNVLFMSGAMKTDGPTGPLLDLIVASRSTEGQAVLTELNDAIADG